MDLDCSPDVPGMDQVAALYREHFGFVWRTLQRFGVLAADIDALAHDVFVTVLQKLTDDTILPPKLSTKSEERAWLYTITEFKALNYRSLARHRQVAPMDDRINEIPDARDESSRLIARDRLLWLLRCTARDRREVFALVDIEGHNVNEAARILGITETNAHRRLGLARKDIEAAAAKLAKDEEDVAGKNTSALLPFGVGAWRELRDLQGPPEGTAERVWKRLQTTMETMPREHDRPATPPPRKAPGWPRARKRLETIVEHLKGALGHIFSAFVGVIVGVILALLFLLPLPDARIAILRIPGPVVVVASSTTPPAPISPPAPSPLDAPPPADATLDEEELLIRQARSAFAAGNRAGTIKAITAYERLFPAGRFRGTARELRATLPDVGGE